jgi:hypothetical protein
MADWLDLDPGESELLRSEQRLWRQMTRWIWDEDKKQPKAHAFGPLDADEQMPSFSSESEVSAQAARDWHQQNANSQSFAVWPITTGDLDNTDLRAVDDSSKPLRAGTKRAPGHVYLDYRGMDKKTERKNRAILLRAALQREEEPTTDIGFVSLEDREEKAS